MQDVRTKANFNVIVLKVQSGLVCLFRENIRLVFDIKCIAIRFSNCRMKLNIMEKLKDIGICIIFWPEQMPVSISQIDRRNSSTFNNITSMTVNSVQSKRSCVRVHFKRANKNKTTTERKKNQ